MLKNSALDSLARQLTGVVALFTSQPLRLGHPETVQKAAEEAERIFQGYAKARPSKEDAYAAALAFVRGQVLDDRQTDLVASALVERIREQGGIRPLGHPRLSELLDSYSKEAQAGHLWRLTWFGLLCSYFAFDPLKASDAEKAGWAKLRRLLASTWPVIDRESGKLAVPDWVNVIRGTPELLGENAASKYGLDFLRGDDQAIQRVSSDLGIPENSWFWHELVLAAVRQSEKQSDAQFKEAIPRLLELIQNHPAVRDDALEVVLSRYYRCTEKPVHQPLRDYVVDTSVWKNPKLRAAGLATAWNRPGISEDVWRMVLQWVNEGNLRDFFQILAARNSADEGRLEFWSQYLKQISWTRLIFSTETMALARRDQNIRELIAREEGTYATCWGQKNVDAFMMEIGDYLVVEFSTTGNAAYVYNSRELQFDRHAPQYHGGTEDLRYGFSGGAVMRIVHRDDWESKTLDELKRLGIYPDDSSQARRVRVAHAPLPQGIRTSPSIGAPGSEKFMSGLHRLVQGYSGARIDDRRNTTGGRLWVEDPLQRQLLANRLESLGLKWSDKRCAWYLPES